MTIVDGRPFIAPSEFPRGPKGPQPPESDIGFLDAISGPAWRRQNNVANTFNGNIATYDPVPPQDRIDVWPEIEGTKYEPRFDSFAPLVTREEVDDMKVQLDQEDDDLQVIIEAGIGGFAAEIVASVVDITSLIPGGVAVGGARAGLGVLRVGARTALTSGAVAAGTEGHLQIQQQTRTAEESAFAIGGSIVLGGILGGTLGAIAGRTVEGRQAFVKAAKAIEDGEDRFAGTPQDLSAAARLRPEITDFDIPGVSAAIRGSIPSGLSFNDRFATSRSAVARKVGTELIGNEYALAGTERLGLEPAAEVFAGLVEDKLRIQIARVFKDDYKAYRKSTRGRVLSANEFGERVSAAMRRGDVDPEFPEVALAADKLRREVVEPMKDRAIKMGLLPEGVNVRTATSYFTRMWDANRIVARSDVFLDRLSKQFARDFAASPEGRALSGQEVDVFSRAAADDVFKTLTDPTASPSAHLNITVQARGPLKERTLNVRDVDYEDFLINDAEHVLSRYARVMSAETELARKFGRVDMKDQIADVQADFDKLRDAATTEKERVAIGKERRKVVRSLEAARDQVRGTYMAAERASGTYRAMQTAMTYKYVTALGDVVLSSLGDVFKTTMMNGFRPLVDDVLAPMIRNMPVARAAQKQIAEAAGISEVLLNNRMMRIADITDPYAVRTPVEKFTQMMGAKASLFSGIMHWNQFLKEISGQLATNRLRRLDIGSLAQRDERFLQRVKLTKANLERVQGEMAKHGEEIDGIFIPNVDQWDARVADLYGAVIKADADTVIVTPGIGDKIPLVEERWFLKPALQLKSFALASHRKTLMAGMQEDKARFLSNAALMVSMGMFVYYLKTLSREKDNLSDNPGVWLAEGIDRSGIVAIFMELNNMAERVGAPGVYYGLGSALGDSPERASRFQTRGVAGAALGPLYGSIVDATTLANAAFSGDIEPGDIAAARREIPFGNHPGIKQFLNLWVVPELKEAVK